MPTHARAAVSAAPRAKPRPWLRCSLVLLAAAFVVPAAACEPSRPDATDSDSAQAVGFARPLGSSANRRFSCQIGAVCYKCPTRFDVSRCTREKGSGKCTPTEDSYCD
jgi:hypothetical protein